MMRALSLPTAEVFVPLLEPSARYLGAHGGRGSGKSHFFAELLVEECVMDPDLRAVCIREVQLSLAQSVKRLIEDKIKALGLDSYFDVRRDEIRLSRGRGVIIFQGMQNHTSDSIKSLEGFKRAWVEEAQSLSQRSLDLLLPTIRADGSQVWFSWNPRKVKDAVEKLLRPRADGILLPSPPGIITVEANWRDNPWINDVLLAEMRRDRERDPDKYQHVWLGKYAQRSSARVFRNFKAERFVTPSTARFMFGADWGFAKDPTVLLRTFAIGRKLYIDRERWATGLEIDHTPAFWAGTDTASPSRWHNPKPHLWKGIEGATRWPLIADSADPQNISYMRRHGFENIRPSIKGPNSVEQGIEFLKSFDIVIHPDECPHTLEEFGGYSYKVDPKTEEVLPVLEDDKNHTIDSARYGSEPLRRSTGTITQGSY